MKSIILGGNGFIGSHLVDRLLSEGDSVRVFDRCEEPYRKPNKDVEYCYGDFGNRALLKNALKDVRIVYHLISTTVPKTSNDDPIFDVTSNLVETLYLLQKCVELNVSKIVFLSSGGTVYGVPTSLPVSESSHTDPKCSYGITKLSIEKYIALFSEINGLDYAILRPSNPYGPRQNPNGLQGAIGVFLGRILNNQPVDIWGDGEVVRDYIYIDDLVDGIAISAKKSTHTKLFNLGTGSGYSLNFILGVIKDVLGRDFEVRYLAGRGFDIPRIYLDIQLAKMELGWTPSTSLAKGIGRTAEFIEKQYQYDRNE